MESPLPEAVRPVAQLGRYELIAEIARGGMGVVYLASANGTGGFRKLVVVKELKQELAHDEEFVGMFMAEAKLSARLNHRNIVQTNEVDSIDGRHFMTLEYLEGRSLYRILKHFANGKNGGFPIDFSIRALAEILDGLHYAHEFTGYDGQPLGVVHRDVAPSNVFITFDGQVKLLDFGVAKIMGSLQETQAGTLKGRLRYMAPEQVNGRVDRRSDVFSIGVMLRELATGRRLWGKRTDLEIFGALTKRELPSITAEESERGAPELLRIAHKAMAPGPNDRYQNARSMRLELLAYLSGRGQLPELGAHIANAFEAEEREVRARIDAHQASHSNRPDVLRLTGNVGTNSSNSSRGGVPHSSVSTVASLAGVSPEVPYSQPHLGALIRTDTHTALHPSVGGNRIMVGMIAVGGVGVLAACIAGAIAWGRASTPAPGPVAAGLPLSAAGGAGIDTAPSPSAAVRARIVVRVSPPIAQIFLDGTPVGQSPFEGAYTLSSEPHTIRAVAAGYATKIETIAFSSPDMRLSLNLERQVPTQTWPTPATAAGRGAKAAVAIASAPVVTTAPAATLPSPSDVDPRGGKQPKREVDTHDPYGAK
jgi:eukaryotic-like serine/threonine-protein kinase